MKKLLGAELPFSFWTVLFYEKQTQFQWEKNPRVCADRNGLLVLFSSLCYTGGNKAVSLRFTNKKESLAWLAFAFDPEMLRKTLKE